MDRGRGHFTPRGRGRGWNRGGGSHYSPSSSGSTDPRTHTPVGAETTSHDHISGGTRSPLDGSGERSWHSPERFSGGKQRPGQSQTAWKQVQPDASKARDTQSPVDGSGDRSWRGDERSSGVRQRPGQTPTDWKLVQPVVYKASAGQGNPQSSSNDKTVCEVSSPELNYQAEIVGSNSRQSDLSSDCTKRGSADGCLATDENLGSLNLKSSGLSGRSSQRNERPKSQRRASWKRDEEWTEVQPVSYLARQTKIVGGDATQSKKSDLFPDSTIGISKSCVFEKGSADGGAEKSNKRDSYQHSKCATDAGPFDICPPKVGSHFELQPSLLSVNKGRRNQMNLALAPQESVLRNGMVLLKNFISLSEQVKVVKECRNLGLDSGGFYQPGYRDGAKLSLRMMCLGKNWDPDTGSYGNIRPIDEAKPPQIPISFLELVKRSIKEAHTLITKECALTERAGDILPWMSPDICIVNFYTTSGRLGLHQDHDESEESLRRGLPVVSISIGDTAEFLYGDERDVAKAEKVTLESGDVLIFGGESRHVFHGVSSVKPDTAPKPLLNETNLRPGRLNLTFREY